MLVVTGMTALRAQTGKIEILWLGQSATRATTVR